MATVPIKYNKDGNIVIPVKFTNPKNNKSVTVDVTPDTGYTFTTLDSKTVRSLGLDESKDALYRDSEKFVAAVKLTVGNITIPTEAVIRTSKGNLSSNTLGITDMHKFNKVTYTKSSMIFEAKPVTKSAAYAYIYDSLPSWKKRI
jgi:hypothetical protein